MTLGSCKSNQAPSPSVASCTHDINVCAVEPGCPSAHVHHLLLLNDHICLAAFLDLASLIEKITHSRE